MILQRVEVAFKLHHAAMACRKSARAPARDQVFQVTQIAIRALRVSIVRLYAYQISNLWRETSGGMALYFHLPISHVQGCVICNGSGLIRAECLARPRRVQDSMFRERWVVRLHYRGVTLQQRSFFLVTLVQFSQHSTTLLLSALY